MSAPNPACVELSGEPTCIRRLDFGLWSLLAATAVLLAFSWARQEGYQIADSVEYLERAQGIAHGQALVDSIAIRSFGFSGLLIPLFWIYDALGFEDPLRIMQAAQLLQIALTLALVAATAQLGARFAGRAGGLAAGALIGFNPIVLRWGVEPVSGVASALFVTLAVTRALRHRNIEFAWPARDRTRAAQPRPALRDAWITGAWLGLAFLMAYQTILVIVAILLVLVVRDLRRNTSWILSVLASVACVVLVQCVLDRWYYGTFGISVSKYLIENFGLTASTLFTKGAGVPLIGPYLNEFGYWLYNLFFTANENTKEYQAQAIADPSKILEKMPTGWYLTNISLCFVAPAAFMIAFGAVRSLLQALRATAILWFVIAFTVLVMSQKGFKDYRLLLPILPLLAALGGIGFCVLFAHGRLLKVVAAAAIAAILVLAVIEYRGTNTRKYGGYWRAIALVNQRQAAHRGEQPAIDPAQPPTRFRLSAAYHWSMFLRESRDVQLIKLPHHLDGWQSYDAAARGEDFAMIATLDGFITHLPVLTQNPDLFEVINRDFAVVAAFYDRVIYDSLGPIYVLERRTPEQGGLRFFQREQAQTLETLQRRVGHAPLLEFERAPAAGEGKLALIEATYTPLAGDGHGWISYVWHGGPLGPADWTIIDRLTAPDHENSWQNNHQPAYGMLKTSSWGEATTLSEGYLVVAEANPWNPDVVYHRMGGSYRRGDMIPVTLWIDVVQLDEEKNVLERMLAIDPTSREPVVEIAPLPDFFTQAGATTLADGMTRAKSMFLPVHSAGRLADDGRPVPLTESQ